MEYDFTFTDQFDRMSSEELKLMQTERLRQHLQWASEHSPFYRERLGKRDWSRFTLEQLKDLPFTTKMEISEDPRRFQAVPDSLIEDIVFSSGTTGKPCRIVYSRNDMARLAYNEHRAFAAAGITKDDTVLLTCTLDRCFIAGLAYYLGVRSIGAAAVRNGLNSIESHAEMIRELQPTALVGVPSFLRHLGMRLREMNVNVDCVRHLICIGEPVRDEKFQLSTLGGMLSELWNASVHSTYASSEIVTSFCDCTECCGGHLIPELAILEIADERGNVLPPGEQGEVVITPLCVTGMPLIRYRTGDISFMTEEPCACGRKAPRLGPILGRKAQMLKFKGTSIYPQVIYSVMDSSPEILEYYVVASGEELSDRIDVYAALRTPGSSVEEVEARLLARCRAKIRIHEQSVEEVRTQVFARSRKPIRFVDRRTKGVLA